MGIPPSTALQFFAKTETLNAILNTRLTYTHIMFESPGVWGHELPISAGLWNHCPGTLES